MKKVSLLLSVLMCVLTLSAQTVTGIVKDQNGEPAFGVNVIELGTTNGTITGLDGDYTINLQGEGDVLQFSFIGYATQETAVAGRSIINVTIAEDAHLLDDFVVTALGAKREKKALGYSVETVGKDALATANPVSPLSGLSGTVSGLNVQSSGGGSGGSVKMVIRGANSLTGSNEPLYVIDGVPLDNSSSVSGGDYGGFDYGNAANNINPDDIESISVLKGGAASALYGSRGQNGVIMITTKSGKKDQFDVSFKSTLSISDVMSKPELQNDYAQGTGGQYNNNSYLSWGPKMNGTQTETNFLGQDQVLSPATEHPYDDFYQTGVSTSNTLSISKGYETGNFYTSATYSTNEGVIPNEAIKKFNINLRMEQELTDWLTMDAKVNVLGQDANNRPQLLGSPDNTVYSLLHMPRSVSLSQMSQYETVTGLPVIYTQDYTMNNGVVSHNDPANFKYASSPLLQNPYWTTNLNTNEDSRQRMIGFMKFNVDLLKVFEAINLDKLNLVMRSGTDFYYDERRSQVHDKTLYKPSGTATLSVYRGYTREMNSDFLLSGYKRVGDLGMSASIGGNLMNKKQEFTQGSSQSGIINPYGNYVLNNFSNVGTVEGMTERQTNSLYGLMTFDYKSTFYLDITGRNDWSSTLSSDNRSFFYPSASFSWIMSESFEMPEFINFMKLRTSWAKVGNDVGPGQIYYTYTVNSDQYKGLPYGGIPSVKPNETIEPEMTESTEVGFEMNMFQNRLHFDAAYYTTGTVNQIFNAPVAPSSGFETAKINAGLIRNQGIEFAANYDVVKSANWDWKINLNFSRNYANVEELADDVDLLTVGGLTGVGIQARLGQTPGIIVGTAYQHDAEGNVMLDDNNLPMYKTVDGTTGSAASTEEILGNSMPKWIAGFGTNVRYKQVVMGMSFDGKFGHQMYSYTNAYGNQIGVLQSSVDGRDSWYEALSLAPSVGVPAQEIGGKTVNGNKNNQVGSYYANPQDYYERVSNIDEEYVYDASYIRLQRLSLGYIFDKPFDSTFESLQLSLVANNLWYVYSNVPNVTPNSAFVSGTYGGVEMFAYPETRTFSFSLKLDF